MEPDEQQKPILDPKRPIRIELPDPYAQPRRWGGVYCGDVLLPVMHLNLDLSGGEYFPHVRMELDLSSWRLDARSEDSFSGYLVPEDAWQAYQAWLQEQKERTHREI